MSDQSYIVECLLQREGGSPVEMSDSNGQPSGTVYHFKPSSADPRHLAVVAQEDLPVFMTITEAYRLVGPAPAQAARGVARGAGEGAGVPAPAAPTPAIVQRTIVAPEPTLIDYTLPNGSIMKVTDEQRALLEGSFAAMRSEPMHEDKSTPPAATGIADPADPNRAIAAAPAEAPVEEAKEDAPVETPDDGLDALSREELVERFKEKFKREPKATMLPATLIDRLRE